MFECHFFGAVGFCSGPVTGLLGRPAAFCEVGFFPRASSLLVACGCRVLFCVVFIGACYWLAWSGCCFSSLFVKLDLFSKASNLLVVCGCHVFCAVGFLLRACHWPACLGCCFSWIYLVELPICLLCVAAMLFVHAVTGLLSQTANFREVGFL